MRVVSIKEMLGVEKITTQEHFVAESLIIENVGVRTAELLYKNHFAHHNYDEVILLVGRGNNGADGMAVARNLVRYRVNIRAFMLFAKEECSKELVKQVEMAATFGVKVTEVNGHEQLLGYFSQTQSKYFVIDAILGTGFRAPLSSYLHDIIKLTNEYADYVVSIDIPSGINGETGQREGVAVQSDETLTIGAPKFGHFIADGAHCTGLLKVIDGGFPIELLSEGPTTLLHPGLIDRKLFDRDKFAHKNTFGHTLTIGGSKGLTGALLLASKSALKVGSGLVTAMTWEDCYQELVARIPPEVMVGSLPSEDKLDKRIKLLERFDSLVIGPGLGKSSKSRKILLKALNFFNGPMVIDADAINVINLDEDKDIFALRKSPTILTPHIGEFARLMNIPKDEVAREPLKHLRNLVEMLNCIIVLKGAATYIAFPNGELCINYRPNSGMATGGSGDVLAGIIGGLYAQFDFNPRAQNMVDEIKIFNEVAKLGVLLHSFAGRIAAMELGDRAMVASSIIEYITEAFFNLKQKREAYSSPHLLFNETLNFEPS